jgi:hypothetical protein
MGGLKRDAGIGASAELDAERGEDLDDDTVPVRSGGARKISGVSPKEDRFPSEAPTERTRVPSEIRGPLPADPHEAARDPRVTAMRELYAAGETEAALFIAQTIDPSPPGRVSTTAETMPPPPMPLEAFARDRVPCVIRRPEELAALPIDHRQGFLLAHVDGRASIEQILDVCAMPKEDAIFLLRQLVAMGVVALTNAP